ncbi:MAG: hypothetical protein RJA57_1226 [Bacteroidota bacterium]|jgi:hypothetical protein
MRSALFPVALALILLAPGCKNKKTISLSGEQPVPVEDFIAFFQPLSLPFQYADSTLRRSGKENDSLRIGLPVFSALIPDTVLKKTFGSVKKPRLYAMGRTTGPNQESLLVVKAIQGEKRAVILLGFDKRLEFGAALTVLRPDQDSRTQQWFTVDRRHTVTKAVMRRNKDGSFSDGRDVYAFNATSKLFYLVMTDALDEKPAELINPIDTLTRTNKWSADYGSGKMNLVSIRDGLRSNRLTFFIHFEKGECTGELKGDADIVSATTAEYRKDGDPCKLRFIFSGGSVTLQEIEGCGSYRPLNCSFNGRYARKKEPRPARNGRGK